MKVTFYRRDEVNIDLEWMAQKLVSLIRFNLKHRIEELIQDLVTVCLEDSCGRYLLDDFDLYDNYYDLLGVITDNIVIWCAENNELFYDIITEYANFLEAIDE